MPDSWSVRQHPTHPQRHRLAIAILLAFPLLVTSNARSDDGPGASQLLSDPRVQSWAPVVTADVAGTVHVIWSETLTAQSRADGFEGDTLHYARRTGSLWSEPTAIIKSPDDLAAEWPAVAADASGTLHLIWGTGGIYSRLYYSHAPACCADTARAWSTPQALAQPILLTPDITVERTDTVHVVYASQPPGNGIFYVRSTDGGGTWSLPTRISGQPLRPDDATVWPRITVDARHRVHVVWSVIPWPGRAVMYARSENAGETWSEPLVMDDRTMSTYRDANYGPLLINVATAGNDVHVLWDGAPTVERSHRWSGDGGKTWSARSTLMPEVTGVGRSGWNDMAIDSEGRLHAVSLSAPFHALWDGNSWSDAERLSPDKNGELVRSVIGLGNVLHVVWLDKTPGIPNTVRYAPKLLGCPAVAAQRLPHRLAVSPVWLGLVTTALLVGAVVFARSGVRRQRARRDAADTPGADGGRLTAFAQRSQSRELLWTWIQRDVKVRYKQSLFGVGWAVFQPLALSGVFAVLCKYIVRIPSDGIPYPIFVYSAMLPWTFLARALSAAVPSIVANIHLVTKVYFPRAILPVATIATHFLDYLCGLAVLVGMMVYYGVGFTPEWLMLPLLLLIQLILMVGLALGGAALNTFFRDVNQMVPLVLQIWMYACPIIYPLSLVPPSLHRWYVWNPMAGIIESYRQVLVKGHAPDWALLGTATLMSVGVFAGGYLIFKRLEDDFADVI